VEDDCRATLLSVAGPDSAALNLQSLAKPGQTLSLLPLLGPARVSTHGLRWPLDQALLPELSSWGLSNQVVDTNSAIELHSGSLLVMAPQTV
jgi:thiamine pyrophosphokinase